MLAIGTRQHQRGSCLARVHRETYIVHRNLAGTAATSLADGGVALVSGREDAMFRQALNARALAAQPVGSVRGLDYSNGQRMVVTLYDVAPR